MPAGETRRLRADSATVSEFLEKLDEASASAESNQETENVRESDRYRYRIDALVVELCDHGGSWTRYEVPSRNISRKGVCVLLGHFVYANTECRVHLVSLYDHSQPVKGKVVRCRYVPGSGRMHEVGIQFAAAIDVALFYRGAGCTRLLVASGDEGTQRTLERIFKTMNFDVMSAANGLEAIQLAGQQSFDAVLMDLEMPELDGVETLRELRNRDFSRPVVALAPGTDDAISQRCLDAGFTAWTTRPHNRDSIGKIIEALRIEPIVSEFLRDPKRAGQIDSFVRDLPERIREMEVAFIEKDLDAIDRIARALKSAGATHGFEMIVRFADALATGCVEKVALSEVRERLNGLSRVLLAARPVSCLEWRKGPGNSGNPQPFKPLD